MVFAMTDIRMLTHSVILGNYSLSITQAQHTQQWTVMRLGDRMNNVKGLMKLIEQRSVEDTIGQNKGKPSPAYISMDKESGLDYEFVHNPPMI